MYTLYHYRSVCTVLYAVTQLLFSFCVLYFVCIVDLIQLRRDTFGMDCLIVGKSIAMQQRSSTFEVSFQNEWTKRTNVQECAARVDVFTKLVVCYLDKYRHRRAKYLLSDTTAEHCVCVCVRHASCMLLYTKEWMSLNLTFCSCLVGWILRFGRCVYVFCAVFFSLSRFSLCFVSPGTTATIQMQCRNTSNNNIRNNLPTKLDFYFWSKTTPKHDVNEIKMREKKKCCIWMLMKNLGKFTRQTCNICVIDRMLCELEFKAMDANRKRNSIKSNYLMWSNRTMFCCCGWKLDFQHSISIRVPMI